MEQRKLACALRSRFLGVVERSVLVRYRSHDHSHIHMGLGLSGAAPHTYIWDSVRLARPLTPTVYDSADPCETKACEEQCVAESGVAKCFCPVGQTVNPENDTECVGELIVYHPNPNMAAYRLYRLITAHHSV